MLISSWSRRARSKVLDAEEKTGLSHESREMPFDVPSRCVILVDGDFRTEVDWDGVDR